MCLFVLMGFQPGQCCLFMPMPMWTSMKINLQMHAKFWLIIIEQYGLYFILWSLSTWGFAGLNKIILFLDKAQTTERNYKTGKYEIVNNFKNAVQNSDDNHKTIYLRWQIYRPYSKLYELHHCACFSLNPISLWRDLAKYRLTLINIRSRLY
jgi:hypothetical protein